MPSVISINDISIDKINKILENASKYKIDIKNNCTLPSDRKTNDSLKSFNIGILFFEPSTRTMMSFQTAINRCNGHFIQYYEDYSSVKKGESFHDTIKTFEQYCDLLIIRHPDYNIFNTISEYTNVPLINAGDGSTEHPSQALLDLFTIKDHHKDILKSILFVGDLKHSRTVNSLIKLLRKTYSELQYYFLSPELLRYDDNSLRNFKIVSSYDDCVRDVDVIYMTRVQYERFTNINKTKSYWETEINKITMTPQVMKKMKPNSILMHPLPRNEELSILCDNDPRSKYFQQMENGVYVRMALLNYCLNDLKI